MGILPNRECQGARSDILADDEGSGSEDEDWYWDSYHNFELPGTEIPKWFSHQSVENSISFWVGHKVSKLAGCIALEPADNSYFVYVSISGFKISEYIKYGKDSNKLWFFFRSIQLLQKHLNVSNPAERNHFEVTYKIHFDGPKPQNPKVIKRWGVHVECICPPLELSIPNAIHDDDDDGCDINYLSELPFYGSDYLEAEEYQPPLVLDDTSNVSWLVGPIAKLLNAFCCLEIFPKLRVLLLVLLLVLLSLSVGK
uniref:C-JID domain-containing protein n=1 Tax=Fagus sylvatica TaxID=28930 RepID=A0A2N9I5F0_FAGSY